MLYSIGKKLRRLRICLRTVLASSVCVSCVKKGHRVRYVVCVGQKQSLVSTPRLQPTHGTLHFGQLSAERRIISGDDDRRTKWPWRDRIGRRIFVQAAVAASKFFHHSRHFYTAFSPLPSLSLSPTHSHDALISSHVVSKQQQLSDDKFICDAVNCWKSRQAACRHLQHPAIRPLRTITLVQFCHFHEPFSSLEWKRRFRIAILILEKFEFCN